MIFEGVELNSNIIDGLNEIGKSAIFGKKVNFIDRQRKNPNQDESRTVTPICLTKAHADEVLDEMVVEIKAWDND